MTGDVSAAKRSLRRELRRRLGSLDPVARQRAAEALCERLIALDEVAGAERIFCCLSFGVEIDTWRLVARLLESGKRVYVPRADFASRTLSVHPYPCSLEETAFGLRQPAPGAKQLPPQEVDGTLEVALIAGLAFDRDGYRLGHGGGFFDRFLVDRPFPALGLAYHLQILEAVPREPHDRPLAAVATDRELIEP
jgi:5-formyltetrahydrofolate cyclo-ligase